MRERGPAPDATAHPGVQQGGVDARLVPPALMAWGAAMAALGVSARVSLVASVVVLVAGLALLAAGRHRPWVRILAAALICSAGAGLAAGVRVASLEQSPVRELAGQRAVVRVETVLTADPRRSADTVRGLSRRAGQFVVPARAEVLEARGATTLLRTPVVVLARDEAWARLLPGQRVAVTGRLAPSDRTASSPAAALLLARGPPELLEPPGPLQTGAGTLREGLRDAVSPLPEKVRGLIPGLVVGDTSRLLPELQADFETAGLTHLLAVSGANCAIVTGFVLLVARGVGVPRRVAPLLAGLALAGFVVLARPEPSVLRAAVMGGIALIAFMTGRRRHGLPALCTAVLLLVFIDPWLARSYGFALSVLATGAILLLAPRWTERMSGRLPRPLAAAVAVPLAAQAVCAPVVVLLSAQVSLIAVPANLLVGPAVPPATILGVLAAVCAPVSAELAGLLGQLAGLPGGWIVLVAERAAQVPHASVSWPGDRVGAVALAAVTLAGVLLVPRLVRCRRLLAAGTAATVGLLTPALADPSWPPSGWVLVACDVGQGDAVVLNAGPGAAVVVDAGPDPRAVDGCLRRLRVQRVPLVVLTHLHADHVEGLPGVMRDRWVGEVLLGPLDEPREEWERVEDWTAAAGVPLRRVQVGEAATLGGLTWTVLWPRRVIRDGSVPNNASLVLAVERAGVRMLLSGDVEPAAQRALAASAPPALLDDVDVLKVPHHGSRHQASELLRRTRPRVAVISAGAGNDYAHPGANTLDQLRDLGTRIWRTDRDGDIAVVGTRHELGVVGSTREAGQHGGEPGAPGEQPTGKGAGSVGAARFGSRSQLDRRAAGRGRES